MRPRIDLGNEDREDVVAFAEDYGYTLPKAYAVLIKRGLEIHDAEHRNSE